MFEIINNNLMRIQIMYQISEKNEFDEETGLRIKQIITKVVRNKEEILTECKKYNIDPKLLNDEGWIYFKFDNVNWVKK
jgi:hypothetical protein